MITTVFQPRVLQEQSQALRVSPTSDVTLEPRGGTAKVDVFFSPKSRIPPFNEEVRHSRMRVKIKTCVHTRMRVRVSAHVSAVHEVATSFTHVRTQMKTCSRSCLSLFTNARHTQPHARANSTKKINARIQFIPP